MKKRSFFLLLSVVLTMLPQWLVADSYYIENMRGIDGVGYWLDFNNQKAAAICRLEGDGGIMRIKGKVTWEGKEYIVNEIGGANAWFGGLNEVWRCNNTNRIQRVEFESDLTHELTISESFFSFCVGLEQVVFKHKGQITIEDKAFENCVALQQVTFQTPQMVRFGKNCFQHCTALSTLDYADINAFFEDEAFLGCTALTVLPLPKQITYMGEEHRVFEGCSNLKYLDLYTELTSSLPASDIFGDEQMLQQITMLQVRPNVKQIPDYLCRMMSNLESVVVFEGCKLTHIGKQAFALTGLNHLPETRMYLQEIDDEAFWGCKNLQQVVLPSSVQTIGDRAFAECPLRYVQSDAYLPPRAACDAFADCYQDLTHITLVVPDGRKEAYRAADTWRYFFKEDMTVSVTSEVATQGTALMRYNPDKPYDCDNGTVTAQQFTLPQDDPFCLQLIATPATGYLFDHWTRDGKHYSNAATAYYRGESPETTQFVAHFRATENFTVSATVNDPSLGYAYFNYNANMNASDPLDLTANSLEIEEFDPYYITLHAVANDNAEFLYWTNNGTIVSRSINTTFSDVAIQYSVDYKAHFRGMATIDVETSDPEAGDVQLCYNPDDPLSIEMCEATGKTARIEQGKPYLLELTATPKAGYRFVKWTEGTDGATVATTAWTIYDADEAADLTLYAHFEALPTFTLSVVSNDEELGTAHIALNEDMDPSLPYDLQVASLEVADGDMYVVDLVAEPKEGARFVEWTIDGESYAANRVVAIANTNMVRNEYFTAHFERIPSALPIVEWEGAGDGSAAQKVLHNGTLYIIRDGKAYNALGAEVE